MNEVTEYSQVIEKLLERSREGKVPWDQGTVGFHANVKSYEFRIFESEDQEDVTVTLEMLDDRGAEIFKVRLTDDPATLGRHRQSVSALKEIYELARRKALNVEEKVSDVSNFLDEM